MHDELKKPSGYLIRHGDGPEPAAHVTSAAAVGGTLEDIDLVANRGENFVVIIKDGKI
jgi:hypothetical protein